MIAYLSGTVREKQPDALVLDVGGVGYLVQIPLSTFYQAPEPGGTMEMQIHTHVREDQITLFGFRTRREMDLFRALTSVHGCGPKMALAALSGMEPDELLRCLLAGDARRLTSIPGIGKKTAERLVLELRDRMEKYAQRTGLPTAGPSQAVPAPLADDLLSALLNLGYAQPQAEKAVHAAVTAHPGGGFEVLLKSALGLLMR